MPAWRASASYARRSLDMDGRYVRGRAFNLALLATASAAQDEPERACAAGRQAIDLSVRLTSARSIGYVRDLVRRLRPRADVPAVRAFTAEVAERGEPLALKSAYAGWGRFAVRRVQGVVRFAGSLVGAEHWRARRAIVRCNGDVAAPPP